MKTPKLKGYKYWISVTLKLDAIKRAKFLKEKGYLIRIKRSKISSTIKTYDIFYKKITIKK